MANVTDPLARAVHGTNPQNLIEYITRQKIYDSRYWKEDCFGLSAADVAVKSVTQLQAIGGSYGGNNAPTRFLCLALKLLQIQPDDSVVDELLGNEDFKYVRALGAFYLRLTGRPADIYAKLEPLYHDDRPLRRRETTGWSLVAVDQFIDELLRNDRVCGIAMPRLPARGPLEEGGYLEGPRASAMLPSITEHGGTALDLLRKMAEQGNEPAQVALAARTERAKKLADEEAKLQQLLSAHPSASNHHNHNPNNSNRERHLDRNSHYQRSPYPNGPDTTNEREEQNKGRMERSQKRSRSRSRSRSWGRRTAEDDQGDTRERETERREGKTRHDDRGYAVSRSSRDHDKDEDSRKERRRERDGKSREGHYRSDRDREHGSDRKRSKKDRSASDKNKKYGSLFKKDKSSSSSSKHKQRSSSGRHDEPERRGDDPAFEKVAPPPAEGSDEYWNIERAKLGLKPLKK